ncbi:hypothetical protein ACGFZA_05530 [Streptomyces sp. NPDC048211]|uniref:hypothetical protein n=1 Tax=Streptomyces sp. NPDC048211 TaxID=3365516 RepID=UPI0037117249
MNQWDPDGQRWVRSAPGGGSGQAPPASDRARVLILVAMVVLLVAVASAAIWMRAHDNGAEGQNPALTAGPEPTPPPSDTSYGVAEPYGDDLNEPDPPESDSPPPEVDEDRPEIEGPTETVQRYYDAINSADFATAWELGGKNLGTSYSTYVSGFEETARDAVSVTDAQDDTVYVDITAYQTDGARHAYTGTYTVLDGVIVGADIERTS